MSASERGAVATGHAGGWFRFLMGARERLPAAERRVLELGVERPHEMLSLSLAAHCSVALELHIEDSGGRFAPQSPRLAQLAVVDVLAAGVALRQNPERLARLQRNSEGARGKRGRHRIDSTEDTHDAQGNQALRTRR